MFLPDCFYDKVRHKKTNYKFMETGFKSTDTPGNNTVAEDAIVPCLWLLLTPREDYLFNRAENDLGTQETCRVPAFSLGR